ncbi:MAG TPA: dienelactone hydrolase family protein [Candidatus Binatia bacterium]|nr:dienelactone hydrolase family protein [Candidatus Binatia bacterium]
MSLIRACGRLTAALGAAAALGACAGGEPGPPVTTAPAPVADAIPATISKPDGPGPFPAVVILHDCSGLGPRSSGAPGRWARELVSRGYLVMLPDSFTPRGVPDGVCVNPPPRGVDVSPDRRARDAYAALAQLRQRPDVDGRRVGVMGGSHGGSSTLATLHAAGDDARGARDGFAAGVALYPRCAAFTGAFGVYRPRAPLLILIGESDDWTPAAPCRALAERAEKAGYPVAIKLYPGAHHSFDSPNPVRYVATRINPSAASGRGATTGGNPEAWADSIRQVNAFFGRHLAVVPSRAQETPRRP